MQQQVTEQECIQMKGSAPLSISCWRHSSHADSQCTIKTSQIPLSVIKCCNIATSINAQFRPSSILAKFDRVERKLAACWSSRPLQRNMSDAPNQGLAVIRLVAGQRKHLQGDRCRDTCAWRVTAGQRGRQAVTANPTCTSGDTRQIHWAATDHSSRAFTHSNAADHPMATKGGEMLHPYRTATQTR
eukprot:358844-Chlamydomonas_euryale.AAC.5